MLIRAQCVYINIIYYNVFVRKHTIIYTTDIRTLCPKRFVGTEVKLGGGNLCRKDDLFVRKIIREGRHPTLKAYREWAALAGY